MSVCVAAMRRGRRGASRTPVGICGLIGIGLEVTAVIAVGAADVIVVFSVVEKCCE